MQGHKNEKTKGRNNPEKKKIEENRYHSLKNHRKIKKLW